LRIPPQFFSESGGKFYIEKEGKKSTNVINFSFFDKNPPCFSNPRVYTADLKKIIFVSPKQTMDSSKNGTWTSHNTNLIGYGLKIIIT
jgi:hypothetical protein